MKLKTEAKQYDTSHGKKTKTHLVITDDDNNELTRENWDDKHQLWGINVANPSKTDKMFIRMYYKL